MSQKNKEIIIKTIDEEACRVICKTDRSNIDQEFSIEDVPNLIKDITNNYL